MVQFRKRCYYVLLFRYLQAKVLILQTLRIIEALRSAPFKVTFFDLIIFSQYADKFCTSELQFGFKCKRSTNMCVRVLRETLSYYANNGRSVFCTFLDSTKAFDRVTYAKLFKRLVHRMLSPVSVRLLLNMYTSY